MAFCSLEIIRASLHHGGVALFSIKPAWATYLPRLRWSDFMITEGF